MSFLGRFSLALVFCLLAAPMRGQYVYVTNQSDNTVSAFSIGTGGALTPIGTYATGNSPFGVAVDHTGHYVYVANNAIADSTVSAYSIGSGGVLTPVTGSPFPTGGYEPELFGVDPTGPYIYVSNNGNSSLSGFEIGSGGVLTAINGSPFATGGAPAGVAVSYHGRYLYVANAGSNTVGMYSIGSGGVLSPIAGFATGDTPSGIAVGDFNIYLTNLFGGTITAYRRARSGTQLTPVTGSPFSAGGSGWFPSYLAFDPKGPFLYVTDFNYTNGGFILAYAIDAKGVLTPIATYAISSLAWGLALDPTNSYLYAVIQGSNDIVGYSVGADGSLTVLPSSPFPAGNGAYWIAITP